MLAFYYNSAVFINVHVLGVAGIAGVSKINAAVDAGDADVTLSQLQLPGVRLLDVDPRQAVHYQNLLAALKREKAEVCLCVRM